MARNKYPEETVKLILDTAARLFMEKGYDGTSLQDILEETHLSKGAIYHHFNSKEDIFERICSRIGEETEARLSAVRDDPAMNGREKLRALFRASILHPNQQKVLDIVPYLLDNPRFLAIHIRELYELVAPAYVEPILNEGVADGSLHVEDTRAVAEAVMVLMNVWLNPLLQPTAPEETRARCAVFRRITASMGLEIIDDEITEAYVRYTNLLRGTPE